MPSDNLPDKEYVLDLFRRAQHHQKLAESEDPVANLRSAIALYEEGLSYVPPSAARAGLHYNIGLAYVALSKHTEEGKHLRLALKAFEEALPFRTPDDDLEAYILTHMNIAGVYNWLSRLEDAQANLLHSRDVHQKALEHCTPENFPAYHASEQMNVGNVYHELSRYENREANLRAALSAYEEALKFYSPSNYPVGYALVKLNAGLVYKDLGDRAGAVAAWTEAESYFRKYGGSTEADRMRRWIDEIQSPP